MTMQETSLGHVPTGAWKFDEQVAACFDDMARRSIPLYAESTDLCVRLATRHLNFGARGSIVDLGCSTCNTLLRVLEEPSLGNRLGGALRLIGVDCEQVMLDRARARLPSFVELMRADIRERLPYALASSNPRVIFMLWTAQFVPVEHRSRLFAELRSIVSPEGALFVSEKLRGQSSRFQKAIVEEYRDFKLRAGYSVDEIDAKARSLEGVLVSLSAPEQKSLMATEGWEVEEVCRYLGFATYYCLPK
jgi:tRNA (cmo5U34)-methyltransferase